MSHPSGPLLLTPGPVALSAGVRAAMNQDRSAAEPAMQARLRTMQARLIALTGADATYVAIPVPGSATLANEMMLRAFVPPGGGVLILTNGAYGDWLAALCQAGGRSYGVLRTSPLEPHAPQAVADRLRREASLTHVAMVHVETSSGLRNDVAAIAAICRALGRGLLVDGVASVGALPVDLGAWRAQALVLSSNKCLQGPPGLAWVIAERAALEAARGFAGSLALDLFDQHQHVERTGGFRFTPPTHVLAGVAAALEEHADEGRAARLARYEANWRCLAGALDALGLTSVLPPERAAPVVVTVHEPPGERFCAAALVAAMAQRGYVIVPGRLAVPGTLRIGCIGAIDPPRMATAAGALSEALAAMGVGAVRA